MTIRYKNLSLSRSPWLSVGFACVVATAVACGGDDGEPPGSDLPGAFAGTAPGAPAQPGAAPGTGQNQQPAGINPQVPGGQGAQPEQPPGGNVSPSEELGMDSTAFDDQEAMMGGSEMGSGGSSMVADEGMEMGSGGSSMVDEGEPGAGGSSMDIPPDPEPPPEEDPAPPAGECPAGQFLCDGFEGVPAGAPPNPALWSLIDGYAPTAQSANIQVSNANARSGNQAVRVEPGGRNGMITNLPQTTYFMRAWLQVDAAPVGPVFVGLGTDQNSEIRLRVSNQSFAVINTVGPGDAVRPGGATSGNCPECLALTPNEWFCAELFVDQANQNATLWIDGQEAANIQNGQGGWPQQPPSPAMFLGTMSLQGGQSGVWIDDVAAGPNRIGCN